MVPIAITATVHQKMSHLGGGLAKASGQVDACFKLHSHRIKVYDIRRTYVRIFGGIFHDFSESLVNHQKHPALLWHLLHYVLGGKNRIEVQPLSLHFKPLVDGLLHPNDLLFPLFDFLLKRFDERRAFHRDGLDNVVVENSLNVVTGGQDADAGVAILRHHEDNFFPLVLHLLQAFLQTVFLRTQLQQATKASTEVRKDFPINRKFTIFELILPKSSEKNLSIPNDAACEIKTSERMQSFAHCNFVQCYFATFIGWTQSIFLTLT